MQIRRPLFSSREDSAYSESSYLYLLDHHHFSSPLEGWRRQAVEVEPIANGSALMIGAIPCN